MTVSREWFAVVNKDFLSCLIDSSFEVSIYRVWFMFFGLWL